MAKSLGKKDITLRKKNARGPGKLHPTMHSRVRKFGGVLYLRLPKPFCESREITEGLLMALNLGRGDLNIRPVEEE